MKRIVNKAGKNSNEPEHCVDKQTNNYQGTFKRYEKKYLLNEQQYLQLFERLKDRMQEDSYGKHTICNLYFDTPDYRLIRRSLEKPLYKEKLRLRSYGIPQEDSIVYIEIKKKFKGVVYKRRVAMTHAKAKQYLTNQKPIPESGQIMKEIDWVISFYKNLTPAMYISYNRIAMYCKEDPNLRITFDSDIHWRETILDLAKGTWGNKLLSEGQHLMEVKVPEALPLWLVKELDELEIYPTGFSKYGASYKEIVSEALPWQVPAPAPTMVACDYLTKNRQGGIISA